ncbi:hypothetical protein VTO58DRAFT_103863 [Aureobasidium pullulans]
MVVSLALGLLAVSHSRTSQFQSHSLSFPSLSSSPHSSRQYCQDESQVEKEESPKTEAQEKKDESQIQVNDSPRQLDHHGSLIPIHTSLAFSRQSHHYCQRLVKLLHDVIETALELNFSSVQALGSTVKSKSLCSAGRQARLSLNDQ